MTSPIYGRVAFSTERLWDFSADELSEADQTKNSRDLEGSGCHVARPTLTAGRLSSVALTRPRWGDVSGV
jgi:hypothetical protein